LTASDTARPSRIRKFQIQNSRSKLPEKFAGKAANYDLALQSSRSRPEVLFSVVSVRSVVILFFVAREEVDG
jgi:hypothetical protein